MGVASCRRSAARQWYDADSSGFMHAPVPVPATIQAGSAPATLVHPGSILAAIPDAALVVGHDGRIAAANELADSLFGFALVGRDIDELLPDRMRQAHTAAREAFPRSGQRRPLGAREGLRAQRGDGSELSVDVSLSTIVTPDGPGVLAIVVDTGVRVARVAELSRQAMTDALTGLGNRAALNVAIARRFERPASESPLVVLAIDLDGLREANRRFGHPGGDQFLQSYAARLRATVRAADVVVRIGGDEFLVLFDGSLEQARPVAARLVGPTSERRARPAAGHGADRLHRHRGTARSRAARDAAATGRCRPDGRQGRGPAPDRGGTLSTVVGRWWAVLGSNQ